jgi:circadian clock protein KaiB
MDTASEPVAGAADGPSREARLVLRLYVAGSAPNSTRAHANLLALLERAGNTNYRLEIVDCIREPQRVLRDGVLVTPTLLKLQPEPRETVIGTLSDARKVALTLGLANAPGERVPE